MRLRQQLEGVEVKLIRRFAIGGDDLAIQQELDARDFCLSASRHRNQLGFGDILRRRLKIIRQHWRQGGNLKFCAEPPDIAFNIADGNIKLMLARLLLRRLNRIGLVSGYHLAIDRVFHAGDILVRLDFYLDNRIFGDGVGEDVVRQKEQRNRYRRAQGGAARSGRARWRRHLQCEVVALAIGGQIRADGDDILAAEEKGELLIDGSQFSRRRRIKKLGV